MYSRRISLLKFLFFFPVWDSIGTSLSENSRGQNFKPLLHFLGLLKAIFTYFCPLLANFYTITIILYIVWGLFLRVAANITTFFIFHHKVWVYISLYGVDINTYSSWPNGGQRCCFLFQLMDWLHSATQSSDVAFEHFTLSLAR